MELAPAYQQAPPLAVQCMIESQSHETTPLVLDILKFDALADWMVITFPELPVAIKLVTVKVALLLKVTVLGALMVSVLNVAALDEAPKLTAPVPPAVIDKLFKTVLAPQFRVLAVELVFEIMIVDVPPLEVMTILVLVAFVQIVPVPLKVHCVAPNVSVRVLVLLELKLAEDIV